MKHIKYPSIESYKNMRKDADYHGLSQLTFTGTVKIHGTNVSVCQNAETGERWVQGRNTLLTEESDNYGFASWVKEHRSKFDTLFETLSGFNSKATYAVYGEWVGPKIQKGAAICNLPERTFIIFDIYSSEDNWLTQGEIAYVANAAMIEHIYLFPHWIVEIDFENTEDTIRYIEQLTLEVERRCPVAAHYGIEGIGEGIVWKSAYNRFMFKTKGEKHKEVHTKRIVEVDQEKVNSAKEFAEKVCTEARFSKLFDENLGTFIKNVSSDIYKEELDRMPESITWKEANRAVISLAKEWYERQT